MEDAEPPAGPDDELHLLVERVRPLWATRQHDRALALLSEHGHLRSEAGWWHMLAFTQLHREHLDEAREAAEESLRLDPDVETLQTYALILDLQGHVEQALELVESALSEAPHHEALRRTQLDLVSQLFPGRPGRAEVRALADRLLADFPQSVDAHRTAVLALERVGGRWDGMLSPTPAADVLRRGLALDPTDAGLLMLSGQVRGGRRVVPNQAESLEGVLAVDPRNDLAAHLLSREVSRPLLGLAQAMLRLTAFVAMGVLAGVGATTRMGLPHGLAAALGALVVVLAGVVPTGVAAGRALRSLSDASPGYRRRLWREHAWLRRGLVVAAVGAVVIVLGGVLTAATAPTGGTFVSVGARLAALGFLLGLGAHQLLWRGIAAELGGQGRPTPEGWAAARSEEPRWRGMYLMVVPLGIAAGVSASGWTTTSSWIMWVVAYLGCLAWSHAWRCWVTVLGVRASVSFRVWVHIILVGTIAPLLLLTAVALGS